MELQNTSGEILEAAAPADTGLDQIADNQQGGQQQVPVHVVQSLRGENQQLKENMKVLQEHLELIRANQPKTEQKQDQFGSLSDDDVLTVGEAKKFVGNMQRQYQMSIEELKMTQTYSDYVDTVKKYLPQVLKEDPDLRFEIENARNPYKMAYYLAKKSSAYVEDSRAKQKNSDAQRIVANAQKPGSLSSVGTNSPVSQASNWKSMPDDEFRKLMNKNLGYF